MKNNGFSFTSKEQICLSMSYIAYTGEMILEDCSKTVEEKILNSVNRNISSVEQLCQMGSPDWKVVWGPATFTFFDALFQSNMMYVTQQISEPDNYIVAIRGTNIPSILNWIREDFDVWKQVEWEVPENSEWKFKEPPKISKATSRGLNILLNRMKPENRIPGYQKDIVSFLKELASNGANITFTGHSLGGALATALSLYFKQYQGQRSYWDPEVRCNIGVTSFASPTIGNREFARYFDHLMEKKAKRIWNTLDIIPHAWSTHTLDDLPDIYRKGGIEMPWKLEALLKVVELTVPQYSHISSSAPFTWYLDKFEESYIPQAFDQHSESYPEALEVPVLIEIFRRNIPEIINKI